MPASPRLVATQALVHATSLLFSPSVPLASAHVLFLNRALLCIAAFLFLNYLSVFGAEWSALRLFHCS